MNGLEYKTGKKYELPPPCSKIFSSAETCILESRPPGCWRLDKCYCHERKKCPGRAASNWFFCKGKGLRAHPRGWATQLVRVPRRLFWSVRAQGLNNMRIALHVSYWQGAAGVVLSPRSTGGSRNKGGYHSRTGKS